MSCDCSSLRRRRGRWRRLRPAMPAGPPARACGDRSFGRNTGRHRTGKPAARSGKRSGEGVSASETISDRGRVMLCLQVFGVLAGRYSKDSLECQILGDFRLGVHWILPQFTPGITDAFGFEIRNQGIFNSHGGGCVVNYRAHLYVEKIREFLTSES